MICMICMQHALTAFEGANVDPASALAVAVEHVHAPLRPSQLTDKAHGEPLQINRVGRSRE